MSGNKVGVEMRQEDVPDGEPVLRGQFEVLIRIALRVDNGCRAGRFVSDQIRGVRQARQIELLQDHLVPTGSG
jgi:hypothetical protein